MPRTHESFESKMLTWAESEPMDRVELMLGLLKGRVNERRARGQVVKAGMAKAKGKGKVRKVQAVVHGADPAPVEVAS